MWRASSGIPRAGIPRVAETMAHSFRAVAATLIGQHLPNASSAQLGLLREVHSAVSQRIADIESTCAPDLRTPRSPPAEAIRERDATVDREAAMRGRARRGASALLAEPRVPHGSVTIVARGREIFGLQDGDEVPRSILTSIVKAPNGALLLADVANEGIRLFQHGSGTNLCGGQGDGYADGIGEAAKFNEISMAVLDPQRKRLLVVDHANFMVRAVTMEGVVTTFAGTGMYGSKDGPVAEATFRGPTGITVAPDGTVFVSDENCIRRIAPDGFVSTFAGVAGVCGLENSHRANESLFDTIEGIALSPDGTLFLADSGNHCVRSVSRDGVSATVAGGSSFDSDPDSDNDSDDDNRAGFRDGPAHEAQFCEPRAVAVAADGALYIADSGNMRVRQIRDGVVSTLAGRGATAAPTLTEGVGGEAQIMEPSGLFLDEPNGLLYVSTNQCWGQQDGGAPCGSVLTIAVPSSRDHFVTRVDPLFLTWLLVQNGRGCLTASEERHERRALEMLMAHPEVGVFSRVAKFLFWK